VLRSRHVRCECQAPRARRRRDLPRYCAEPLHGCGLARLRARKRIRRKVSGKTKQEIRAKLQALHREVNAGVKSSSTYTVRETVDDWLREAWTARPSGRARSTRACWGRCWGYRRQAAPYPERGRRQIQPQSARRPLLHSIFANHPELAGTGHQACRSRGSGRAQCGGTGEGSARADRSAALSAA
jgi:hypothetical protein